MHVCVCASKSSVRVSVCRSLKQQPVLGSALKHNNGILGKNSLVSVGGEEREMEGVRKS